jgi:peptidoglycan hydrolase-like protein with peptidoglycan-binding domain
LRNSPGSGCLAGFLALAVLAGATIPTQAQQAPPAAPAPIDPAQIAAKSAFEALPEPERKAIQTDLIWTGHFNGVASGEYGARTFEAIRRFERQAQQPADGILSSSERVALRREAETQRQAAKFAIVTDQATGIRIGLPQAVLNQRVAVENGTVHRRADGLVSLQLVKLPPAPAGLAALFDTLRQDAPGRKVTYRLSRPDWFVVSGEEGARRFYTRIAQGPEGLRGYTFRYPANEAAKAERLMIAIANSFEPFPGTGVAANPASVPAAPTTAGAAATSQPRVAAPPHAISAVRIAPDRAITSAAALESCLGPRLAGQPLDPARIEPKGTLALVTLPTRGPFVALGAMPTTGPVFALSRAAALQDQIMVSQGVVVRDGTVASLGAALQTQAGGAPVLDATGKLVALVQDSPAKLRLVGDIVPLSRYRLIDQPALAGVMPSPAQGAATTLATATGALVAIGCTGRR